jgi:hypothetical protein
VGQIDAGGQQNRRQQPEGNTHGVDQSGVAVAPVWIEQRSQDSAQ